METNTRLPKIETVISQDTQIAGNINTQTGTMRIDGNIDCETIISDGIIVGVNGCVKGNLEGNVIVLAGNVSGDIIAKSRLEIMSTAIVRGNVSSPVLSIAEGAFFEGCVKMEHLNHKQEIDRGEV